MTWVLLRPADDDDYERLLRTCLDYLERYDTTGWRLDDARLEVEERTLPRACYGVEHSAKELAYELHDLYPDKHHLTLLRRRIRRALRDDRADGIAYDHVGRYSE